MSTINNMNELVQMSMSDNISSDEHECQFTIEEEGETFNVYAAAVAYRDIILYTKQGALSYVVDSFGDRDTFELMEIER